jgi:hypothetical protein
MNSAMRGPVAARPPSAGLDDLVIVPLVLLAAAISKLLKAVFSILIYVLDYAFPILLQLMRIPLLTVRLVGDGLELFLEGFLQCLPISRAKRDAWRARMRQQWIWFRRNISYQAFEQALHHAFETGMAWVFRECRMLTPSGALMVIAFAFLWLPISFGTATALHATLIARANSLPAWCNCCTHSQRSSLRASCWYCRSIRLLGHRRNNIQLCRGFSSSAVIA